MQAAINLPSLLVPLTISQVIHHTPLAIAVKFYTLGTTIIAQYIFAQNRTQPCQPRNNNDFRCNDDGTIFFCVKLPVRMCESLIVVSRAIRFKREWKWMMVNKEPIIVSVYLFFDFYFVL